MIKLWFVPEILVLVREMSLKFDFWGRHACTTAIIISIVIIVVWSSKYSTITDFMIFCFHNHYLHNSN